MNQPIRRLFVALILLTSGISGQDLPQSPTADQAPADEIAIAEEIERLKLTPPDEKAQEDAVLLARQGIEAHDARNYHEAVRLYREALERDPLNGTIHYELGLTLTTLGEQTEALKSILRALALNPRQLEAYGLKAAILDNMGYPDQALAVYDLLLELQPDNLMAQLNRGITLSRISRFKEATEAFRQTIAIDPEHPSAYFYLARLALAYPQPEGEAGLLESFLERAADDPRRPAAEERLAQLRATPVESPEPLATGAQDAVDQENTDEDDTEDDTEDGPVRIDAKDLPALMLLLLEKSPLSYELGVGVDEKEAAKFQEEEGKRFRQGLQLTGDDPSQCESFEKQLLTISDAYFAPQAVARLLRCHRLDVGGWERLRKVATTVNLSLRPLPFQPEIDIKKKRKTVKVRTNVDWVGYAIAKAALRYEEFAARMGIAKPGEPSLREEELAVVSLAQGYLNSLEKEAEAEEEEEEEVVRNPFLDTLTEIAGDETILRGYVLFEILQQNYGIDLRSLNPTDAAAVESYLLNFVVSTPG